MRFYIDGRFDVRPLTAQDKAHEALPYDYTSIRVTNSADILDTGVETVTKSHTDWGTNKDFYVTNVFLTFLIQENAYINAWDGIGLNIYENDGSDNPGILGITLAPGNYPTIRDGETGLGVMYYSFITAKNKVAVANTIGILFKNLTGQTIENGNLGLTISGIAI